MGYFGELDSDLVAIKELCENILAKYGQRPTPWGVWKDTELDHEKGTIIENYSPSLIPVVRILKELGPEGKYFDQDHTFFSFKELFKLIPKIPEILLAIEEHRVKILPKVDELNKMYEKVQEEHKIAKQAIIQFTRS